MQPDESFFAYLNKQKDRTDCVGHLARERPAVWVKAFSDWSRHRKTATAEAFRVAYDEWQALLPPVIRAACLIASRCLPELARPRTLSELRRIAGPLADGPHAFRLNVGQVSPGSIEPHISSAPLMGERPDVERVSDEFIHATTSMAAFSYVTAERNARGTLRFRRSTTRPEDAFARALAAYQGVTPFRPEMCPHCGQPDRLDLAWDSTAESVQWLCRRLDIFIAAAEAAAEAAVEPPPTEQSE